MDTPTPETIGGTETTGCGGQSHPFVPVIRPVAGPGAPGRVFDRLRANGWASEDDECGNTTARWVGDGHVVVVTYQPEDDDPLLAGLADRPLWRVVVNTAEDPRPVWEAVATTDTPAELVALMLTCVTDPEPLWRDPLDPGSMLRPRQPLAAVPPPSAPTRTPSDWSPAP